MPIDEPDEPVWVDADFTRLAQAFANLLNNAVKYTDRGGLHRRSRAVERAVRPWSRSTRHRDRHQARAELPRIFDMFMQVDQRVDRARGGLGIGLTLASG